MALFLVTSNPRWRPAAILDNFEWPNDSFDPFMRGHLCYNTAFLLKLVDSTPGKEGYLRPSMMGRGT